MNGMSLEGKRVIQLGRQSRGRDGSMSLEDQFGRMDATCERDGAEVVGRYSEEDISGRRPLDRRNGLRQAVLDIEQGRADVILTAYFDRFVRSVRVKDEVLDRVEAKGGNVVTLDLGKVSNETAMEWLNGHQHAGWSEYYSRLTAEKTHESKQRNINRGIPPFPRITPAYRRRPDGTLEQDPTGAPIVREAIAMRLADQPASYATIARWMTEQGIAITPGGVEQLFASPLLVGEIHFGSFTPNLNAIKRPLITRATQRRLLGSKATKGRYGKSEQLLARLGILRCETCDARMTVDNAQRGRQGVTYSYYRCGNRLCAAPAIVSVASADEVIRDEAIRLGRKIKGRASAKAELEQARLAMVEAEGRLDDAIRTLAGLGDRPAARETLDALQADHDAKADHYNRLAAIATPDRTATTASDWDRLLLSEQREAIRSVIETATVSPGRGPGRIRITPARR